jgi:hypothetical protein
MGVREDACLGAAVCVVRMPGFGHGVEAEDAVRQPRSGQTAAGV